MLRVLSDENFEGDIIRALRHRIPNIDLIRVQDVGLRETADPQLLEWCATARRVLLTHDRNTIPGFAVARIRQGLSMPGVFVVDRRASFGALIDELVYLIETSEQDEWTNDIVFVNPQ
jgi:hypothetical protein